MYTVPGTMLVSSGGPSFILRMPLDAWRLAAQDLLYAAWRQTAPLDSVQQLAAEHWFYINQARERNLSPAALELDTAVLGLLLLMSAHAVLHRRLRWMFLCLVVGVAVEQLALRAGEAHCHGEALVMISQCSSGSSPAMQAVALYACQLAAQRLPLHVVARPFTTGILTFLCTFPYVSLGVGQGWWVLAGNAPLHSSIQLTRGPIWTFRRGSTTMLEPSQWLAEALAPQLFGTPTVLALVAAGLGIGVEVAITTYVAFVAFVAPCRAWWAIVRLPLSALGMVIAIIGGACAGIAAGIVPAWVVLPALMSCGVSQPGAVAATMMLLLVPPLLLPPPPNSTAVRLAAMPRSDSLLFAIPLWKHTYLLMWPAHLNSGLASGAIQADLYLAVVVASALSLAVHARASLFDHGHRPKAKAREMRQKAGHEGGSRHSSSHGNPRSTSGGSGGQSSSRHTAVPLSALAASSNQAPVAVAPNTSIRHRKQA